MKESIESFIRDTLDEMCEADKFAAQNIDAVSNNIDGPVLIPWFTLLKNETIEDLK